MSIISLFSRVVLIVRRDPQLRDHAEMQRAHCRQLTAALDQVRRAADRSGVRVPCECAVENLVPLYAEEEG